jgi:hypothetical protein
MSLSMARAAAAQPDTIFGAGTPVTVDSGDGRSVELGVKFTSEAPGSIMGIRFYKASTNTGTHIGSLWSVTGTLLAAATFTSETASGWQQVNFSTPVAISANTTYIAGYLAPKGHYSDTSSAFASSGVSNPPLSALANSISPNGVYTYSATSTLPTSSYKATNYWVDVNFEPEPVTAPGQPTNVSATAGPGSATVTWSAPTSGGAVTQYIVTPYIGSTAQPATTVTGSPPATSATINGLTGGTSYTFTVQASNSAGPGPVSAPSNAVTPVAQNTIFGAGTPATVDSGDGRSVELGVKFTSEVAGSVTGIRFYKAATNTGTHVGSLWSVTGTLLAAATFTSETASGWQQVNFSTPVAISANTTYIAGYLAPKGHYSDTSSAFASSGVSNPPLSALANSISPNGVYTYSATSTLPTSSYKATNYWVDVNFEPEPVTAPGQPTNVSATAGPGSATVTWSAPTSGGAVTQYIVTPYIGSTAQPATTVTGSPPATSATINGLTGGTSYTFTVQASNSAGPGPVSAPSNAVTPTALTAPSAPTEAQATAGNGSATVTWTAPANGGSPITSYTVTPYNGSTAQPATMVTGSPPATSATISGLTNGTSYTFTVTATNTVGAGPPSSPSNAVTPSVPPIAYPDLQVLMPTNEISIIHSSTTRTLEFSHVTWDAGEGPLEIRPHYNEATGISQGYQALYTMPSPGVWKFDHTVPIVGPMIWTPPTDYNFPLAKFWLYNAAAGGGVGSLVASSPKVDFCMTPDVVVGGVPNTPTFNPYYVANCGNPEGTLGLNVGWGDKYDATDGGEGIDITSLPNGTYWLRGEVDPYHYFQESSTSNNITDTKLQIEGETVKVLEQTHPSSTPPTVTLTSPASEATLSGTATLTATASGPASISSVQFLLDGQPIGSPVTTPPYTMQWNVGSTPAGKHFLSAQATDSGGFVGTAPDVPVTTQASGGEGTEPPAVSIVNPTAGQVVSGTVPVSANVSSSVGISSVQFYLDGKALGAPVSASPYAISWDTTTATSGSHKLSATATDTAGKVGTSATVEVAVQNPAQINPCFVMDANVSVDGHGTVTTPSFITAEAGEQLLALVGSDGPAGAERQSATVSGAGLTWTLVARANSHSGDAEIWAATAPSQLTNATITSTPTVSGYDQSLTVISMEMSLGTGASVLGGATSGAPSVSLNTTEEGSLAFAVGNDYDTATARTLGSNQVMLHQYLDTKTGDTYWSQYTGQVIGPAGSAVTLNDVAPTNDQWNMAAVELRGDGPGK